MPAPKINSGLVAGLLTAIGVAASYAGKAHLAAFLGDPATADAVTVLIGSAGALIAGALEGFKADAPVVSPAEEKPAAPDAPTAA